MEVEGVEYDKTCGRSWKLIESKRSKIKGQPLEEMLDAATKPVIFFLELLYTRLVCPTKKI